MSVDMTEEPAKLRSLWDILDQTRGQMSSSQYGEILAPLAALLFLRWAGKFESEQEAIAAFDGTDYEPTLPDGLRWEALQMADPQDLGRVLRQSSPRSEQQNVVAAHLGTALDELSSERAQPLLPHLFRFLDALPFETPSEMAEAESLLAEVIPNVSQKAGWYAFEYYTPEPICELMVGFADPQPGDRIYDPCFGVGGLLVESARRLRQKARQLPPQTWLDLGQNTFYGVELNKRAHLIGLTRLLLLGFHRPGLQVGDTLLREPYGSREKFSCVLAVPPWGGRKTKDYIPDHFPVRSRDALSLFVQHIALSLRPNGRAVIAVPISFLFKSGEDKQIRKMLLREFCLEGVIGLPEKSFAPYTMIGGNLVLLRKREPAENVRFLRVPGLAGAGGARSEIAGSGNGAAQPAAIVEKFRAGKLNSILWETPVKDLAQRDWDLQVRCSGDDALEQFLRALQDIDEEIPQQQLGKVADVSAGISYSRTATTENRAEDALPLIRVADVTDKTIREPDLYLLPELAAKVDSESLQLKPGDVLLTTSGTIGKVGVVDDRSVGAIPAKSVVTVRPKGGVLGAYLEALLRSDCYQKWMRGHARGATIQHLSLRALRNLPVPVPAVQLQASIVNRWRNEGGDVSKVMLALLTHAAPHPLITWLETDSFVTDTLDAEPPEARGDRLSAIDRIARVIVQNTKDIDTDGAENLPKELLDWARLALPGSRDLAGIDQTPIGPSRFSLLRSGMPNLLTCSGSFTDSKLPVVRRAGELVQKLYWLTHAECEELASSVRVSMRIDPEKAIVGEATELMLRLQNEGPLPLRDFEVTTRPDIGACERPFFEEKQTLSVPLKLPPQTAPGVFDLNVHWHCTSMDFAGHADAINLPIQIVSTREQVHSGELMGNPYNGQLPVVQREMFFGRADVRNRITTQLQKTHPAGIILLLGNRRMGKTSILNRLRAGEWLPDHVCVYCDLQGGRGEKKASGLTVQTIYRLMARDIGLRLADLGIEIWHPHAEKDGKKPFKKAFKDSLLPVFETDQPLEAFESYLELVLDSLGERRLLLMLDEFDKVQEGVDAGITSPMFSDNLRFLVHTYRQFSMMLVGVPAVRNVRNRYRSPLFGVGETIAVGPLAENEAHDLVTKPVSALTYVPEAADTVVDLCACRANLVQKMCDQVFTLAHERKTNVVTLEIVEQAARDITIDNEYFATLWDEECETERQRFILCVCVRIDREGDRITYGAIEEYLEDSSVGIGGVGLEHDIEHLCDAEILRLDTSSAEGAYVIAVPLMRRWLMNKDFQVQQRKAERESEKGYV